MKPPVEAPASRARRPVTGTAKRASAASSFSPPRLTKGAGGPQQHDGLAGRHQAGRLVGHRTRDQDGTGRDGRLGLLAALTRPRRTSSVSSRRRAPVAQAAWRRPSSGLGVSASWPPGLLVDLWLAASRWPFGRRRLGRPCSAWRACLVTLPACVGRLLGAAGPCGGVLGRLVACLVRLAPGLGRLRRTSADLGRQGPRVGLAVDLVQLGRHLVAHQLEDLLAASCGSVRPMCPPTPVPGCAGCLRRSPTLARSPRPGHGSPGRARSPHRGTCVSAHCLPLVQEYRSAS